MSQTKSQLIGNVSGGANFSGIVTATSLNVTNINSTGVITATSLNVTDINSTGVITATSLNVTDINSTGVITATSFSGDGSGLTGISSVSFATTSFGLNGNPTIFVSNAGINTTNNPTNLYVSGTSANNVVGLGTTDANTTLNFTLANDFSLTLTGSIILENPTGVTTGQSGVIHISQDSNGNHTVGFGSHWDFVSSVPPILSTTANALDTLTYTVRNSTSIVTAALVGVGTI